MKAGDEGFFERRKRKPPKQRLGTITEKKKKYDFNIACYSGNVSSSNENTLLLTLLIMMKLTTPFISNTEILFEKHDKDSLNKRFLIITAWRRKHWKK